MKMFDGNPVGVRSRYLAEEKAHTEELFAKAAGFKTPITKPAPSFKAPGVSTAAAKPKAAPAKPTGALPSSGERLKALKDNMAANIGATTPSSGAPAAVGTVGKALKVRFKDATVLDNGVMDSAHAAAKTLKGRSYSPSEVSGAVRDQQDKNIRRHQVGQARADRLRRGGKFSRTKPSTVAKSVMTADRLLRPAVAAQTRLYQAGSKVGPPMLGKATTKRGKLMRTGQTTLRNKIHNLALEPQGLVQPLETMTKAEPLKTSISEDDARKLVGRHGLKGPLPKDLSREQRMAAYEARYVSAGGKKAEKWHHRAQVADKVKTGGLGVATAGTAGWLATRGKKSSKLISPAFKHHAETLAGAGATAGGAGELYAGHARRKRSSYASAPAGVARSALTRMQAYTP